MSPEIEISFGTLFKVKNYPDRTDVVINTGKDDYFEAARLHKTEDGKDTFFWSGTAGPENIEELAGKLTPEQVFEAYKNGAKRVGIELPEEFMQILIKYSQKGPRKINY